MIKLIMSDMDGTLLDEKGNVPAEFDEIAAELKKRGVIFAPASGRQYYSLAKSFAAYVDDFIFVAENGTMVRYKDKELFASVMNRRAVLDIFAAVPQDNILKVFCGRHEAYMLKSQKRPEYAAELEKYYSRAECVDDFACVTDDPIKVSLFDLEGKAAESIYPLVKKFEQGMQVTLSSDYWVDVIAYGINKGIAVQKIQKKLKITPMECAAFGDYLNDAEMMSSAYYSFAMANAHPDLKKLARFQTDSNVEHGVITGIKRLMEQGLC